MKVLLFILVVCLAYSQAAKGNLRPIIGILNQPSSSAQFLEYGKTFIVADYIKWIESAGSFFNIL
jgi:hypothetical protein